MVTQAKDDTVYAIIENHSDEVLELKYDQEVGYALPLRTMKIGKHLIYEMPESDEGMYFLHSNTLKEHILLGNVDSVLPIPHGYDKPEKPKTIDIDAITADRLTEEQLRKLKQILKHFEGVFSTGPGDFGKTPLMSFRIETGDAKPYAARYYPIPLGYRAEVKEELKNMRKNGIVEDANSPWSSNLVIVKKPNGKLRICANLKGVNAITLRTTSFPINFQEESLYKLSGGKYYFQIDLSQAYYAIPIDDPEHRDKTAFYTFGSQMRFKVSPFGAKYLPSQFNHLMATVLGDVDDNLFFYFDDIIGSNQTVDAMLRGLADVLQRLWKANLRVNFQKSDFAPTSLDEIKWLGSIIHNNRIRPDHHKVDAILKMKIPKKAEGIQHLIGAASFHRRHIKDFAKIAAPLTRLFLNETDYHIRKEEEDSFAELKTRLTSAPALALPNLNRPMIVTTDASDITVGGCLSQPSEKGDGKNEDVIAYCSRVL